MICDRNPYCKHVSPSTFKAQNSLNYGEPFIKWAICDHSNPWDIGNLFSVKDISLKGMLLSKPDIYLLNVPSTHLIVFWDCVSLENAWRCIISMQSFSQKSAFNSVKETRTCLLYFCAIRNERLDGEYTTVPLLLLLEKKAALCVGLAGLHYI